MKFREVATVFDAIAQTSARLEITALLADLFKKTTPKEAAIIANLSLGMLRPAYQGSNFNFSKKSFLNVLAEFADHSRKAIEKEVAREGDIGLVMESLSKRKPKDDLTVLEVYKRLEILEQTGGEGSQEEKKNQALQLLKEVDPISAKYIVRMVVGELRLGFSDMTIIDALSWMETGNKSLRPALEEAYNVCADIGVIASTLKEEGIEAIKHMKIHPGIPIRLAAAERLPSPAAIIEKIGSCVAQPKLDGLRLQVHLMKHPKKGSKVTIFSRNLLNVTHMFPDIVPAVESLDVETMICDGEAIVYDANTDSYLPFQETAKRKRKHGIEQAVTELPIQLNIFDLLYLDGADLLASSHEKRRALLKKMLSSSKNSTLRCIDEIKITEAHQLEEYFLENINEGLEGVVVKKPTSPYQAGKRNFNWIKLKRLESGTLEDTIDVVILGYNFGEGKRASFGIGAFLVGVYNKKKDNFQTLAKVGTGLSDEQWKKLKKKCDEVAVRTQPKNVECAKELIPDIWIAPEIVCCVRADEITLSPLHTAGKTSERLGFALRFPRFMGYREDKTPEQTTEVRELEEMFHDQKVRKK